MVVRLVITVGKGTFKLTHKLPDCLGIIAIVMFCLTVAMVMFDSYHGDVYIV